MKKTIFIVLALILSAGFAYADTVPTDQEQKDLERLSTKLVKMRRDMDKFIKDVTAAYPVEGPNAAAMFGQDVRVDVVQTAGDIIVKADLPGMDKDKIEITLENGKMLKIAGSREVARSETAPGVVRQERMSGRFERALELPAECLSEGIKATYKSGVLEIVIPKKKVLKEEMVKIKVQ